MRVISGTARGTKLYTLEGNLTRPTLDRVKESVFNIIQNKIRDAIFLDLFSGSGAISIEAASRGAEKVIACDKSKDAIKIINKNIEKTHLEKMIDVYNLNYMECLRTLRNMQFDIIYIDPPYKTDYAVKAIENIIEFNLYHENTIIIVETDDENIIKKIESRYLQIIDKRKYGRAIITFLKIRKHERKE